jgi:hypothetical protein
VTHHRSPFDAPPASFDARRSLDKKGFAAPRDHRMLAGMRWLVVMILVGVPLVAHADHSFVVDFGVWGKPDIPATADEAKIGRAYLQAMTTLESEYGHAKIAQVRCNELAQDLVSSPRFYHCAIGFAANASDGGPWDAGRTIAWDGKELFVHQDNLDGPDPTHPIGLRFIGVRRFAQMRDLNGVTERPLDDAAAVRLSRTLGVALTARFAKEGASGKTAAFLFAAHLDSAEATVTAGLASVNALKKDYVEARVDGKAYDQLRAKARLTVAYTRGFCNLVAGATLDASAAGLSYEASPFLRSCGGP